MTKEQPDPNDYRESFNTFSALLDALFESAPDTDVDPVGESDPVDPFEYLYNMADALTLMRKILTDGGFPAETADTLVLTLIASGMQSLASSS